MNTKCPNWYKPRSYPHFDKPISFENAKALVESPTSVSKHAFMPFISFTLEEKRYKKKEQQVTLKVRPISCCAHKDATIFSYYAYLLGIRYEDRLKILNLNENVLAYRKFPRGKSNIDFANDIFEMVKYMKNCVAIAFDVKGFFDNLDHQLLKKRWSEVVDQPVLSDDHYAVFKAITKYSKVSKEDLYKALGFSRRKQAIAKSPLTTPQSFRAKVADAGLIKKNPYGTKGIPQGSPISAVLSNIYMLELDHKLFSETFKRGAVYRRYSDDILVLCSPADEEYFSELVPALFQEQHLELSADKTQVLHFSTDHDGTQTADSPLQYLGFEFNGKHKLIRSKTISKYHRKMRSKVRSVIRAAVRKSRDGQVRPHKKSLYRYYSHFGSRNFISYAKRACEVMGDPKIWDQNKKSWRSLTNYLNTTLKDAEKRLNTRGYP